MDFSALFGKPANLTEEERSNACAERMATYPPRQSARGEYGLNVPIAHFKMLSAAILHAINPGMAFSNYHLQTRSTIISDVGMYMNHLFFFNQLGTIHSVALVCNYFNADTVNLEPVIVATLCALCPDIDAQRAVEYARQIMNGKALHIDEMVIVETKKYPFYGDNVYGIIFS